MPGIILSGFHLLAHLILSISQQRGTVIILTLRMRKLRPIDIKKLDVNPDGLALGSAS